MSTNLKYYDKLQQQRQKLIIKGYLIYFIATFVSAIIIAIYRRNTPFLESIFELFLFLSILTVLMLFIYFTFKYIKNYKITDNIIVGLTMFMYIFSLFSSTEHRALAVVIQLPSYLILIMSTMNKLKLSVFIIAHTMVIVIHMILYPTYLAPISTSDYIIFITIAVVTLILAYRFISLYDHYHLKMSEDNDQLNQQNAELRALNEEYYATQEELHTQYDEILKLNEENVQLAYKDVLTGADNRNAFIEYLNDHIIKNGESCYVVYCDIARFKDINSVYGYHIGDQILINMYETLNQALATSEIIVRISGDLFAVVVSKNYPLMKLISALDKLNKDITINDAYISVKIKAGILPIHNQWIEAKDIIQAVDLALNKSKDQLNNFYYIYDNQLNQEIENRVILAHHMDKAIENKQIYTQFQGVISSKTKELVSFEALARWTDSKLGVISPADFIPIAEKTGMIIPLGDIVIEQVCAFIKKMRDKQKTVKVTINISGVQLSHEQFAEQLMRLVEKHQVPFDHLGVEVTETDLIGNLDLAVKHLETLRDHGFSIYLDDFGTGYSSLNYLDKLPIDVLKIDRSFIFDIDTKPQKQRMLNVIVNMAKTFNLKTVAEGVENLSEFEFLKNLGVDYIQGFLFHVPKDASAIYQMMHISH